MRVDLFICPVCAGDLVSEPDGRCLRCDRGHSFDVARQGYVSLVTGSGVRGDTAAMVQARADLLASGVYEPIADGLADAVGTCWTPTGSPGLMADLGGGTGWYAARLLDRFPDLDGVLLDASAQAAKAAVRAHPRLSVATTDLWKSIPLRTASVDLAVVVFAPRNPGEIARILVPGGACLVVTPRANHLRELRATLPMLDIEADKDQRLLDQFAAFEPGPTRVVEYQTAMTARQVAGIVHMGPSAYHVGPDLDLAPVRDVTVAVTVHEFRTPGR
ncbi:MAG: SAM-dependent methyltransferase [Propionibacteriaceae bacterium]|nr:SAM-dependent methyltransferase [Propionibacteriaceae bacterium]